MILQPRAALGLGLALAVSALGVATAAHAFTRNVTFCNKSAGAVDVAFGYDKTGTSETTSEGWIEVPQCGCKKLFGRDVRATEAWIYVTRKDAGIDAVLTSGKGPLCVQGKAFTILGPNKSQAACTAAGGKWVNFQMVNAVKANHTVNFGKGGNCVD